MSEFITKIKQTFLTKQFIIFVIIGVINTFNGSFFSYIYSLFLNSSIAFGVGYISGLIISYILNSLITFKEKLNFKKFIKFAISTMPNFIIQYIVVLIVINILDMHQIIAYILAAAIGVPVTFILLKFFAFKNDDKSIA